MQQDRGFGRFLLPFRHFGAAPRLALLAAVVLSACLFLRLQDGLRDTADAADRPETEIRLEQTLRRIEGLDDVYVMINCPDDDPARVEGVAIVVDGMEDISVYLQLRGAVQTLLGVEANRIRIIDNAGHLMEWN